MNAATRAKATLKYFDIYKAEKLTEKQICRDCDYSLTTKHPGPLIDHDKDERDPTQNLFKPKPLVIHVLQIC